ncbi:MAG: MBL fold metallo-hydrolase [Alphaproteobacteria bacterium]|nr:MBL fold metallo-hydrolase [Alphaproteobacteria bacterium]MBU1515277.1 MBL fold metallo-hydrolase [Alphaproteobacteria bacterium]MBU2092407.1 MBL fold metallo-hydrolase [Alphaproteobacteria bacterium]MBU2153001.1 MBL fold metallo-hydrolase [Alphaproteobacteria bacterium]MBU2305832.1 MBL fold metallo-hydrolase [Alphaproteobacteria bacterium]
MIRAALAALALALSATTVQAQAFDGLKVIFCGTSGPLPIAGRAKPCTAIQAGGALYLVDIGPEATENLMTWRLPMATAKAVFITHLHSDHIGDLGEFNMQSWVAGRPAPLAVVGPAGVDKLASGMNLAYENDHGFRKAHHEHGPFKFDLSAGLLAAKIVTIPKPDGTAVAWKDGGLTVTAIRVHHDPIDPAFAYRFDYKGRSVVVSGDTIKWAPLAVAAKGADVLVHEAQNNAMTMQMSKGLAAMGNARMSSLMADTVTYHTQPVEAADLARAAGVKALVLSHLTQAGLPFFTPEAFTKGMDDGGKLDWRLAKDGMTIELPAGSADVRFGSY